MEDTLVDDIFQIVTDYLQKGIIIGHGGIFYLKDGMSLQKFYEIDLKPYDKNDIMISIDIIKKMIYMVPYFVKKTNKKFITNNCQLKHIVKNNIEYIDDQKIALVMLYLKYNMRVDNSMNPTFNCKLIDSDGLKNKMHYK